MPARRWSWIQFVFAFAIAGGLTFLNLEWALEGLWIHIAKTSVVATACGALAGRFGDSAWQWIVCVLE